MTSTALLQFRSGLPGCELALYADVITGTVFASDSDLHYPQEYLDALCTCAAQLFSIIPSVDAAPHDHVLFATPTGARIFLRSETAPAEALCCICGPACDYETVLRRGRAALAALGSAP